MPGPGDTLAACATRVTLPPASRPAHSVTRGAAGTAGAGHTPAGDGTEAAAPARAPAPAPAGTARTGAAAGRTDGMAPVGTGAVGTGLAGPGRVAAETCQAGMRPLVTVATSMRPAARDEPGRVGSLAPGRDRFAGFRRRRGSRRRCIRRGSSRRGTVAADGLASAGLAGGLPGSTALREPYPGSSGRSAVPVGLAGTVGLAVRAVLVGLAVLAVPVGACRVSTGRRGAG